MEKTIKMSEEVWKEISKLKYDLGAKTLDDVLKALLKNTDKIKLASELNRK